MKELKIEIPEGYEIDKEKSSFEKIVFKKKTEVNCWEDLKTVKGAYINVDSKIYPINSRYTEYHSKNIFLNDKYAKSSLALAQISQLLPYYDTDVDWGKGSHKYCIERVNNEITIKALISNYSILAFNSASEAERFLKHNEPLVKDFYML